MKPDIVVVGCGYAGAVAAIAAHDHGARVLVVEKMRHAGGISVCSAGGVRIAFDPTRALEYLVATNAGTTPLPVLKALANGMAELPSALERLASVDGARISTRPAAANYPFPGHDAFGFATVDEVPGFDPAIDYPHVRGSAAGARLFRVVEDNLRERGIEVRLGTPALGLLRNGGRVEGVDIGDAVAAHAVVLASGGFEADPEMKQQFWQAKPVLSAAFLGNTGDGIRMAQSCGAALWHMWHYHGSYGFRHPDTAYPYGIRTKRLPDWFPGEGPPEDVRMPWILLDKSGRRFMNEYEPYLQDTGHRPFERFVPEAQDFAQLPAWLVADEAGRKLYPFGRPTYNDAEQTFAWSTDNRAEIELGILETAQDTNELARIMGVAASTLEGTLERWNRACRDRVDEDYRRPGSSMMPIAEPPYYCAQVWPIVSNTQGGPAHDERQRVLDVYGEPIPGLFAAGEIGSVFGHLYLSGGNLAECFVGGGVAGREATAS